MPSGCWPRSADPNAMPRILLVEDDEDIRLATTRLLERRGYAVVAVETAEQALERFGAEAFALVLTDLLLPGMDGAELCRAIRADPRVARTPVVVRSNMGERMGLRITPQDAAWAPIDCFIDKSAPFETLLAKIETLLAPASAGGASRGTDVPM